MSQSPKYAKAREGAASAIRIAEGFRLTVYPDSEGYPTVGWGHKVTPDNNLQLGNRITRDRAEKLFGLDITLATCAVSLWYCERLKSMKASRIAVLIEMAFCLGSPRFSRFAKMSRAIDEERWKAAGAEIKDSRWYREQGVKGPGIRKRILRLEAQMASGRWQ